MSFKSCRVCTTETGRHPGCHDHCERYAEERAEWDRKVAIQNANSEARMYTYMNISRVKDALAKRESAIRGHKWFRR